MSRASMVATIHKDPLLQWRTLLPRWRSPHQLALFNEEDSAFLFLARHALYHGLAVLGVEPGDAILVPAYHCSALVEPILAYGARVRFYDVKRDCSPNLEDVATKIDPSTKALLCIHYFGFPQPLGALRRLCDSAGIYLIEDCAHVFGGTMSDGAALGTSGDISVFSVRKFLPIQDGGVLLVNNPRFRSRVPKLEPRPLSELKAIKDLLDRLADEAPTRWFTLLSRLWRVPARLLGQMAVSGAVTVSSALTVNHSSLEFDRRLVNLPMTKVSRRLLWNSDSGFIKEKRRDNYRRLMGAMQQLPALECVFSSLPDGVSPMVFPLIAKNHQNFHLVLRERGVPAVTWGGVVHRDLPENLYPDAWYLYDRLVMLPLHQDIGDREIQFMVAAVVAASKADIPTGIRAPEPSLA